MRCLEKLEGKFLGMTPERATKTVYEDQHAIVSSLATHVERRADTLRDPPQNINTSSPRYNPNAKCAYHSNSPGHDIDNCWALKNKIQDMIEAKQIEFDPPVETPRSEEHTS